MRKSPVDQQVWTTWTMLLYFINAIYDAQIAALQSQIAAIGGASTTKAGTANIAPGASSTTVTHNLGLPNSVGVTPNGSSALLVWGSGGYYISGKTNNLFSINLATPAPAGGINFDWMVMAV